MKLAFWIVVDFIIGILMLIFGDPKTQFAGLWVIGILLVTIAVVIVLAAVSGVIWSIERWLPHSVGRLEALAADLFLLGVIALVINNTHIGSWNPILVAYLVVQLPLLLFGRTPGQILVGFVLVHDRVQPRGLADALLEEAVLQMSMLQALLVLAAWLLRQLPGIQSIWKDLSVRNRVVPQRHSPAHSLATILALGFVGIGSCSLSIAPQAIADSTAYNRAQACLNGQATHPPTCLVEVPATVLDVHADFANDHNGNVTDAIYYIQVSINGNAQSLQADTTQGLHVINSLYVGEQVIAGTWNGELVLVRSADGDVWQDGGRPGENSGAWLLWVGLGFVAVGLVVGAVIGIGRARRGGPTPPDI